MWFSLFSTVLILAITFYQGLQGLFTGLINCILAMISAALAFGFYENVYFSFLADKLPDLGRPIALVSIFVLSLLILRVVFDMFITGNVTFPVYVDRAGGGIFGFITAMIVVGMLSLGFQMLPFPPDFMGFSRFKMVNSETSQEIPWPGHEKKGSDAPAPASQDFSKVRMVRNSTWLNAGGFTASLVSHLSSNALRGNDQATFHEIHPDFTAEIFHAKANPLGGSRLTAKPSSLDIVGYWDLPPGSLSTREFKDVNGKKTVRLVKAEAPDSGLKDIVIRVKVQDAKDEGGDVVRFTPSQVRLFARDTSEGPMKPIILAGINDDVPQAQNKLVQVNLGEPIARSDNTEMDFVFRVPDKSEFKPVYLEFKQDARAEITPAQFNKTPKLPIGSKAKPVKPTPRPKPAPENTEAGSAGADGSSAPNTIAPGTPTGNYSSGRVAVLGQAQAVVVSNELPANLGPGLTDYGGDVEQASGTIKGTHDLVVNLNNDWQPAKGNRPELKRFEVARDKRLVHISVERLQAGSTYGKALQLARENVEDFYLNDTRGNQYRPVGMYAMADVHGKKTFELIFLNAETEQDFGRLPKFSHIHRDDFQGQYALVYLFIVPPGTKLKDVHTGGHAVDVSQFPEVK